jgi:hypothetical protein
MTDRAATNDHLNSEALAALPDDAPVVMLNLMRFRGRSLDGNGSSWNAYLRYSMRAIKLIKAQGGTIVWTGTAEAVALGVPDLPPLGLRRSGPLSVARGVPLHDDVARVP